MACSNFVPKVLLTNSLGVDILSHEASNVLCEEVANGNVSDECRVLVLCKLLLALLSGDDCDAASYKLLIPLITPCLTSAKEIEQRIETDSNGRSAMLHLLDVLWERLSRVLAKMLSQTVDESKIAAIPNAIDLADLVEIITQFHNTTYCSELCSILSAGALRCLEVGKFCSFSPGNLKLFGSCFGGICQLNTADNSLPVIAKQTFDSGEHLLSDHSSKAEDLQSRRFNVEACLLACQVMQDTDGIERVVISVFPSLCELIGSQDSRLRNSVGRVLSHVNVGQVLDDTTMRCATAERRAHVAEKRVATLTSRLEQLLKEKEALERQLAFID